MNGAMCSAQTAPLLSTAPSARSLSSSASTMPRSCACRPFVDSIFRWRKSGADSCIAPGRLLRERQFATFAGGRENRLTLKQAVWRARSSDQERTYEALLPSGRSTPFQKALGTKFAERRYVNAGLPTEGAAADAVFDQFRRKGVDGESRAAQLFDQLRSLAPCALSHRPSSATRLS